jgi:hypothetical protein
MVDETFSYREPKKNFWRWPSRSLLPVPRLARRAAEDARRTDSIANARVAAYAMLIAFALFIVFESEGIRHFTRDLPGCAVTDVMVEAADRWHAWMLRLGPARVQPAVRAAFDWARTIQW